MIFKLTIVFVLGARICDAKSYENYTLFRGIPIEDSHLEFFRNLSSVYDVNFWREPGVLWMPVDFVISPIDKKPFLKEANRNGVYLTTVIMDVQSAFNQQTVKPYITRRMDTFDWHDFYKTEDIYNWLYDLERTFPREVHVENIGKTHENRDILAVRIILKGSLRRSKVIIEGGIHAREWISPAFVTYMIHKILYSSISGDRELRSIAKTYDWYFVPVLNPDGYEYTHSKDRLWRKNRNGAGTDLNRNFGYSFGIEGVSFVKNDDIYCGEKAFSEMESSAMAKFVSSNSEHLEFYFSFHSYGQYMIIPYAHSVNHVENFDEMKKMGLRAAEKIKSYHNMDYTVGTAYDTVGYTVGGTSSCWVKKSFEVPYVMTLELRDNGNKGFALPPSDIIPTCEETMGGMLSLLKPSSQPFGEVKRHFHDILYEKIDSNGQAELLLDKNVMFFVMLLIQVF